MTAMELVESSLIVQDNRFQVRQRVNQRTIERYANVLKAGNSMPPIQLARVNGALVLIDGWHRLEAMRSLGLPDLIDAQVITATESEARWLAAKANLEHGLPLQARELRTAFKAYVRARQHNKGSRLKSYREICSELGGLTHHTTIRNWMLHDFPRVAEAMSGDQRSAVGGTNQRTAVALWADTAISNLNNVRAAFAGITNASERGRVIQRAEALVSELRQSTGWEAADF